MIDPTSIGAALASAKTIIDLFLTVSKGRKYAPERLENVCRIHFQPPINAD
jgi:hypothetical protein